MDITDLVEDIKYSERFDYEKRVDLFNKYGYSTAQEFFVPIWALSQFIREMVGTQRNSGYQDFGHGQRVLMSDLKEKSDRRLQKGYPNRNRIRLYLGGNHKDVVIFDSCPGATEDQFNGKLRLFVHFSENGLVSVNNPFGSIVSDKCKIPRDFYQKIDQWLIDFGYEELVDKWNFLR